jgi:hypothetical protein
MDSFFDLDKGRMEELKEADEVTYVAVDDATEAVLKDRCIADLEDKLNIMITLLTKKESSKNTT